MFDWPLELGMSGVSRLDTHESRLSLSREMYMYLTVSGGLLLDILQLSLSRWKYLSCGMNGDNRIFLNDDAGFHQHFTISPVFMTTITSFHYM
jgi:hypothetical protein